MSPVDRPVPPAGEEIHLPGGSAQPLLLAIGITVASVAPRASEQARELGSNLPAYGASIQRTFNDLNRRFDRLRIPEEMQARVNEQAAAIGQSVSATVGAFFDFTAGNVPRAPATLNKFGIEWIWRLFHEPKRMWRRKSNLSTTWLR